jgi:hypothetical protein
MAERPQPRIIHVPINKQVGPHATAHRKNCEVGHGLARPLRKYGKRRKGKGLTFSRLHIEADADRMARAQRLAADPEHVAQARV